MSDKLDQLVAKISTTKSPLIKAALVEAAAEIRALQGVSPAPAPTPTPTPSPTPDLWTVLPPQAPITSIVSPSGIDVALNVNNLQNKTYTDYAIDNTGNSAVLLQGSSAFVNLKRFHITHEAAKEPVAPYGDHGIYAYAHDLYFEDIYVDGTGHDTQYAGSGISSRMRNHLINRLYVQEMPFIWSYFEEDLLSGTITLQYVTGKSLNGDCSLYIDAAINHPMQKFVFAHGKTEGGTHVLTANAFDDSRASVSFSDWYHNGNSVTAGMIKGVPSSQLAIA